jgi:hypothetical protein
MIECTPALWRLVRAWRAARGHDPGPPRTRLGPWTATTLVNRSAELMLAVERHTCLTLVFELGAEATFAAGWKRALTAALQHLGVPSARIEEEASGAPFRFERLAGDASSAVLSAVEFVCETSLHYHSNLELVQCNLNEFPHDHPPDYTATAAIRRMFRLVA